jgi:hypothetical protein
MDCQEYFVDLEMSLIGVATALEVSAPGKLRDEQVGAYRELEQRVGIARGLANKLRARHLEAYNRQGGPVAYADTSGIWKALMMARVRLDEKLAVCLPPDHAERSARLLLESMKQEEGKEKPSAPPPSPPEHRDTSEGAWPWFSGKIEDLAWFRQAWETHARQFHHGMTPEVLVGGMRKYCVPREISRMIEPARDPEEAWRILESHFNRETKALEQSIEAILGHGRMVNDNQTLAHYNRILVAIRNARQLGRLSDLLTEERIDAMMELVPRKENEYWKGDLKGVRPRDRPVAFYSFVRLRALELGPNTSPLRCRLKEPGESEPTWVGPCLMGDLCGKSHVPEECDLFIGLPPEDRLVIVAKKRVCYLCFRHTDNQPCRLQFSLPACPVEGCMRMHSRLLHQALQKEEAKAIVIEVGDDPEEPGEDEEFYAANFEILGQEDEDEGEEMISEGGVSSLGNSDEARDEEPSPYEHLGEDRPRLCQQQVPLEVNGNVGFVHVLYDWETPNTLMRIEAARRMNLQSIRIPRRAIRGYQGVGTITDSAYCVPLLDADGNVRVIRAYGVEEIAIVVRTRLPPVAVEIFPVIRLAAPWMETRAGHVDLLIGLDNKEWLPTHVEDSWDPDDDMRLMKSAFGHRYMITDGWGRDLLPPDNSPDDQAGAQRSEDEQEETAQEVQLPEYRGWSQGTGVPGSGNGSGATAQRGGGTGARPKTRRPPPNQVAPPAKGGASREDRPRGSGQEPGPPARTQIRFGNARPQASGRTRSRLRMVPPPKRRPSPSPPPAQGQRSWDWNRQPRRGQGPRGTNGRRTPFRSPSPSPRRARSPLQMVRAGDNPMQKLAMMMAVMILGMSPAHAYSISADPGSLEVGGQMEMMPPLVRVYSDDWTLTARNTVSSVMTEGYRPVEPGGYFVEWTLQQAQLEIEDLERTRIRILGLGENEAEEAPGEQRKRLDPEGKDQVYRLEDEATPKTTEALRRGADAARGRGRSHQKMEERN